MKLLHPVLAHLWRLRLAGRLRSVRHAWRSPSRAAFFIVGVAILASLIGFSIKTDLPRHGTNPQAACVAASLGFFLMWASSLLANFGEYAISFSPPEVDLLFSGPFTRRELLIYKLATMLDGMALSSLMFSLVTLGRTPHWVGGFVGIFLGLWFIYLLNVFVLLVSQAITHRLYSRVRKALLAATGIVIAAAVWYGWRQHAGGVLPTLGQIVLSPWLKYATAPFSIFGHVTAAGAIFPGMLAWASLGFLVDVGLVAAVIALDADYLERAADASRRVYARRVQMRRSGVIQMSHSPGPRGGWPRPMRAWGAGPIAWKQLITAARGSRGLLLMLAFIGTCAAVGATALAPRELAGSATHMSMGVVIGLAAWLCMFLPTIVRFDFRCDLASIEILKALPISSFAVAVGEIAVPVAMISTMEFALAACGIAWGGHDWRLILAAAFVIPFNLVLFGLENLFFLLWPTQGAASSPGDFQFMGRQAVTMVARFIVLIVGCSLAFIIGLLAMYATGKSRAWGLAAAWTAVALEALATLGAVAWAYRRFDVASRPAID